MSRRALELNLEETDIQELRLMQKQPNLKPRVLTRCNALLFLNEGKTPKEVANLLGFRNFETLLDLKKDITKEDYVEPYTMLHVQAVLLKSYQKKRLKLQHLPAPIHQKEEADGHCVCWLTKQ